IEKSYSDGKGILGIYIHGFKSKSGKKSCKGCKPLADLSYKTYDPSSVYPHLEAYECVSDNIDKWIESAT
ncbi:MAG: hypothetical protein AAGE99_04140, partial [Chlamydiota bacterium]